MIEAEEQLLAEAVLDTFRQAAAAEAQLAHVELGNTVENVEGGPHAERLVEATETLRFHIRAAFRHVGVLAERLGLPAYARQVRRAERGYKDVGATEETPWDVHPVSPALAEARELYRPLEAMLLGGKGTALAVLERVLRATASIIGRAGASPASEHQVVKLMLEHLSTCFDDVVDETQILQAGRKMRCDVSVQSLRAAVEFKFIDSAKKVRPVIDSIIADVRNYSDDPRWRSFFVVVYQTGNFLSEAELREKLPARTSRAAWQCIVVQQPV